MTTLDRLTAALADRYRLDRELGQGGMATVYLAEDLKHGRDVAIKVLHPDLGAALGAERFLAEIKVTAKLQHPHILPLLDSGAADGLLYYVMPFVRGETLRVRLERERQLPISDALRIAREVAAALEHAHAQGIIHRDIKPENILLQDGAAVVADFGIALAVQSAGGARMTQTGLSLGTPQYMSPEQAMGERTLDARSDIYALGAVTYEMLAGEPPFTGNSVQAIVAKVLTERPTALRAVRDTVPEGVEAAVLQALAKLPADRFASAADFVRELSATTVQTASPQRSDDMLIAGLRRRARWSNIVTAGVVMVAVASTMYVSLRTPTITTAPGPVVRFDVAPPLGGSIAYFYGQLLTDVAIAPDASQLVVTATFPGTSQSLGTRRLDESQLRLIPGTADGSDPVFSPDGRWIAFSTRESFKKVAADGSGLSTLYTLEKNELTFSGSTWLSDRELVLAIENEASGSRLVRLSAAGGTPEPLTTRTTNHFELKPLASPDGRFVFFTDAASMTGEMHIAVARVSDGTVVVSKLSGSRTLGLVDGRVLYVRTDGTIQSAAFDEATLQIDAPVRVGDGVAVRFSNASAALSTSGTLIYQNATGSSQLVQVSETGDVTVLVDAVRGYRHPRLSPDGRRLVFDIDEPSSVDIWLFDLAARTLSRVTNDGTSDRPEWSPDGQQLIYLSSRDGARGIWGQSANGQGGASLLYRPTSPPREAVYTPDGQSIVYRVDQSLLNRDIWRVSPKGERRPEPVLTRPADDIGPRVSPDGRWLAFQSSESGRIEVYVRSLAGDGRQIAVSADGGGEPIWSRDGKRLFYRSGGQLSVSEIDTAGELTPGTRRALFPDVFAMDDFHGNYDTFPDGRSFVMVRPTQPGRQIQVVVNWASEVRRRLSLK